MAKIVLVGMRNAAERWCRENEVNPKDTVVISSDHDQYKVRGMRGYRVVYVGGSYNIGSQARTQIELRSVGNEGDLRG